MHPSLLFCGHASTEETAPGSRCRLSLLIRDQSPSGAREEPPTGQVGSAFGHCPRSGAAGSHSRATMEAQQAPLGTKPNLRDTGAEKALPKKMQSKALGCPVSRDTRYARLRYDYLQAGFVRSGSPECHTCSQIPAGNNVGAMQGKASSVPPSLKVNIRCQQ